MRSRFPPNVDALRRVHRERAAERARVAAATASATATAEPALQKGEFERDGDYIIHEGQCARDWRHAQPLTVLRVVQYAQPTRSWGCRFVMT